MAWPDPVAPGFQPVAASTAALEALGTKLDDVVAAVEASDLKLADVVAAVEASDLKLADVVTNTAA